MDKLVRKESGADYMSRRIGQEAQAGLIIAGLMMLEAEMSNLIAERKQEVILAIMRRAEQPLRLFDKLPVFGNQFRRSIERVVSVGGDIKIMRRIMRRRRPRAELDPPEVAAGQNWRIHECGEGNRIEFDVVALRLGNRQR